MIYAYIILTCMAAFIMYDDIALGHIHPVKGFIVAAALVWSLIYTTYQHEKGCK